MKEVELTILFPCLNEENTVESCIKDALEQMEYHDINGEVLVCDNGSTDRSVIISKETGARVVHCREKGYGNALRHGIEESYGKYVIMADCDCSYHLEHLGHWMKELRDGADMIIGNRYEIPAEKGAMKWLHRYFGVPLLSFLGRVRFQCDVVDFHCGLRAVNRNSFLKLNCRSKGMEFATEMIGRASLMGQSIGQVAVKLYCDKRGKPSHLRSIRDGLRHLVVIITKATVK